MAEGGGSDGEEKTLDPSPQRVEKARREGDVPRSADVNTFAAYLGLFLVATIAIGGVAESTGRALTSFLAEPDRLADQVLAPGGMAVLAHYLGAAAVALAPVFLAPALGALLALIAQRAIVVAPSKIEPKLSRLSPIDNAKQKFGADGIVEFLKALVKLCAIAAVVIWFVAADLQSIIGLVYFDARLMASVLQTEAMVVLGATLCVVGVIAVMDYFWQAYSHNKRLMMSFQEMKDDLKGSEGDPHFKMTRRQRGREIAMNRSIQDVPKADVVIVNPTHFSVALAWSREAGSAPVVVSKGVDLLALKIREVAGAHAIPIHRDPPTARVLFDRVEIGQEIPPEHYQAVAVAIRFADDARRRAKARGWRPEPRPGGDR